MARPKNRQLRGILDNDNMNNAVEEVVEVTESTPATEEVVEETIETPADTAPMTSAERLAMNYQNKIKKPTMEESHIRTTFLLRKDLRERLDSLSDANGRGFKTEFFNTAVESLLDELENQ